jgi:HEAT repeat protein
MTFAVRETGSLVEKEAADKIRISDLEPRSMAPLLRDPNPFVRLKALTIIVQIQRSGAEWTGILGSTPEDAFLPVRRLAVRVIAHSESPEWSNFLEKGLQDQDQQVRDSCAIGLALIGRPAPIDLYDSILWGDRSNGWPIPDVYGALSKQPTPDVMSLLLRHPIVVDDFEDRVRAIDRIGKAAAGYPKTIELLLHWRNPGETHWSHPTFAQALLASGGQTVRAPLYDALSAPDRVARSNGARALALMKDQSAIPRLIAALDLESGLSRVSIVWALGKLRATAAIPKLVDLYLSVAPRSASLRGDLVMAQAGQHIYWQYEQINSVDALKASWDALAGQPAQDPRAQSWEGRDDTLMTEHILAALAEIGPMSAQDFYRRLASSTDTASRHEAAVRLSEGGADNVPVLRGLSGDRDNETKAAALVNLFLIGDDMGRAQMLRDMERCAGSAGELWALIRELGRVSDVKRLSFLKPAVQECEGMGAFGFGQEHAVDRLLGRNQR